MAAPEKAEVAELLRHLRQMFPRQYRIDGDLTESERVIREVEKFFQVVSK